MIMREKGFGKVKIGKQLCKKCDAQHHEDKSFWKKLLADWKETMTSLIMTLRCSRELLFNKLENTQKKAITNGQRNTQPHETCCT